MSDDKVPSYAKIHYLLRPAKNIQRKMMCEMLQRLDRHFAISQYRYVGFGSIYFGDFSLFHRALGIRDMVTIEGNEDDEDRVRFNVPYSCIDVKMGFSNAKLPEISLTDKRWIIWLDYDFCIDATVLKDVRYAVTQARPGSVLAVTLDADFKGLQDYPTSAPEQEFDAFQKMTPREKLAFKIQKEEVPADEIQGEGFARISRELILTEIGAGIAFNYDFPDLAVHQLLNFRYADGREMMTVVFLFLDAGAQPTVESFDFGSLDSYRPAEELYRINAPKLTPLEIRRLNQALPGEARTVPIPADDYASYRNVYRYFPAFAETEL